MIASHNTVAYKGLYLVLLWSLLVSMASCQVPSKSEDAYHRMLQGLYRHTVPTLTVSQLKEKLSRAVLLDVREAKEYAVSHLPEARLCGYEAFDWEQVRRLPKDTLILVYCSVGYRSERMGEALIKEGYTQVYNLYGGIFEWVNQGNALLNDQGKTTEQVHSYNRRWAKWLRRGEAVW